MGCQKMHIYCKKCNKHTSNTYPKKIILISKDKIKGKSRCAICLTERTFIDETEGKYDLESELEIIFNFLLTDYIKMKTYWLNCKRDTENIDPKIFRTKNKKLIMQSQCTNCRNKNSRFVKKQKVY